MTTLLLIKHSQPEIRPELPASHWQLSPEGRTRCGPLAQAAARFAPELVFTSREPKASETARLLAASLSLPCQEAEGLHEHLRPDPAWRSAADFNAQVANLFARPGELVLGAETADQAHARFSATVSALLQAHPGQNMAVVAHGTVITLFVTQALGLETFPFWQRLGLPALVALRLPGLEIIELVESF